MLCFVIRDTISIVHDIWYHCSKNFVIKIIINCVRVFYFRLSECFLFILMWINTGKTNN